MIWTGCLILVLACQVPQGWNDWLQQAQGAQNGFPGMEAWMGPFQAERPEDRAALEAIEVTREEERRLGQEMLSAYLDRCRDQRVAVLRRGEDVEYLERLSQIIHPRMQNADRYRDLTVLVLRTEILEARSFPDGTQVYSQGLLESIESEAALLTVVAHELSHLDRGHQLLPVRRWKLMQQTFTQPAANQAGRNQRGRGAEGPPGFPGPAFWGGNTGPEAVQQMLSRGMLLLRLAHPFRPEDERVADEDAVKWVYRSGYDPRSILGFFAQQDRKQLDLPLPTFLSTHPQWAERAQALRAQYDALQREDPREDLYVGRENLRRRLTRDQRRLD